MAGNPFIREFKPDDLNRVMFINRICLPENYSSYFYLDVRRRFSDIFLVAEENGRVLGYVMCEIDGGPSGFQGGITKKGHVISIAVLPEFQHRGIGCALMERVMRAMRFGHGASECYLEVRATNTQAIDFYGRMGFKILRAIERYYADGETAYILSRVI